MGSEDIKIVLCGRNGSGKSTLLQNLSGQDFDAKKTSVEMVKDGVALHIIDMPSSKNLPPEYLENGFDVLVYCMSISPNSKFQDGNPKEMQSLQKIYGEEIWKHSIIAFTFSNLAWKRVSIPSNQENSISAYKAYIEQYSKAFHDHLQNKLKVKMKTAIWGVDNTIDEKTILAIPVGDTPQDQVLPGATSQSQGWIEVLVEQVIRKGQRVGGKILPLPGNHREENSSFQFGGAATYMAIVAMGALIGYISGESPSITIAGIIGMTAAVWLAKKYLI